MHDRHFTGAVGEMKVASYFLSQGNQVYFPVVQQGAVDMVVDTKDGIKKVQVKTASINDKYMAYDYIQCRITRGADHRGYLEKDFDILAVVFSEDIWLIPWSEVQTTNICLESSNPNYRPRGKDYRQYKVNNN